MLKIVDVHTGKNARGEYLVLQNLGIVSINLRGWALCTEAYLQGDPNRMAGQMYVFRDEVDINPYVRIVLFTGHGEDRWMPTVDGRQAYCVFWNRDEPIWSHAEQIHVLQISATRRIQAVTGLTVAVA